MDILLGMRNIDELQTVAVYAREHVNPALFNYAFSQALLHRTDTKDLQLPSLVETFPEKFVDSRVFSDIREEATVRAEGDRTPIIIPIDYTASNRDPEHR